jgi:hypothetical protein
VGRNTDADMVAEAWRLTRSATIRGTVSADEMGLQTLMATDGYKWQRMNMNYTVFVESGAATRLK